MADCIRFTLASSACIEPLVARWPAWPHTLAPVAHCLHLANYQIDVLQSYLENPRQHELACKNPRLLGGPFIDIPAHESGKLKALLETTLGAMKDNIEFAEALSQLSRTLAQEAKGESLEQRYASLPAPLRGHVELFYDYLNNPIVRCLEGALYKSRYYKPELQSLRLFDLQSGDDRPYYMSTPRLDGAEAIDWRMPFADARLDDLFRLDTQPAGSDDILELLGIEAAGSGALTPLLEESRGKPDPKWRGEGVRIRYFGHACVLVETRDIAILVDPLVASIPREAKVERFSWADLPHRIDYALVTHGHHDHFVVETLLRLRHRIATLVVPRNSGTFYADFSLRLLAENLGFSNVREVDCFDEIAFEGGRIMAIPFLGEHNDLPAAKSAYLIETTSQSILFAADSNCLDAAIYEPIQRLAGPIDVLFVGMECVGAPLSWVYGPMLPQKSERRHDQSRRSNGCDAAKALTLARSVQCKKAFVYAVGREPWIKHLLALNPAENDPYIGEIDKFIAGMKDELQGDAKLLFGKSEILV
jgi:L-ascorbate metabolism protein UlaG (beta-lactamase superfamily)